MAQRWLSGWSSHGCWRRDASVSDRLARRGMPAGAAGGPAAGGGMSRAEVRRQAAGLAALGREMFFDARLSGSGRQACASCHDPEHAFGPPNALAVQLGGADLQQPGLRAVPSLKYLQVVPAFTEHFFDSEDDGDPSVDNGPTGGLTWDGRVDRGHQPGADPAAVAVRDGQPEPGRGGRARARRRATARTWRRSSARAILDDRAAAFDAIVKAFEVYEQDWRDLLSLQQQVRRLSRRRGDADARRAARARAVRRPGQGQLRRLPHQRARQRRHAAAVHRLRPDRARPAAQPGDPGQRRPGLFRPRPVRTAAHRSSGTAPTIAACSARRRCATSRCARPSSTTASSTACARRSTSTPRATPTPGAGIRATPTAASTSSTTCRRNIATTSATSRPSTAARPGDPPALTDAEIDDLVAFLRR